MAGNNSCGSRSIAYGNMVHNVLGASAWLSTASWSTSADVGSLGVRAAGIAQFVRGIWRGSTATPWPSTGPR
jgi:FAD/FMN-containing dehydrogenase